jgi:Fe-S-cluster containining protein
MKEIRSCGDCIACCVYLKIPALDKPGLAHCQHLNLAEPEEEGKLQLSAGCDNCSIYEDRPEVCKSYSCMWLAGYGDESDRPDKSFMLIDTIHRIENAVECKPLFEGAEDTAAGRQAVRRISRSSNKVALVTSFYETKLKRVVGRPS